MTAAFTFPGQGSQAVGMGKALAEAFPAARAVFDEVDSALAEKLTAIIWDGPAETLQLTENAQPALMAVSIATLRVLGYTPWQVGGLFLRESMVINFFGTLLGLPLGYCLAMLMSVIYDTEMFRFPLISPPPVWINTGKS